MWLFSRGHKHARAKQTSAFAALLNTKSRVTRANVLDKKESKMLLRFKFINYSQVELEANF